MKSVLYVPSGLVIYFVVTGLLYVTEREKATRSGDALIFGPMPIVAWLIVVLIVGFAGAACYVSLYPAAFATRGGDLWIDFDIWYPRFPVGLVFVSAAAVVEIQMVGRKESDPVERGQAH